MESTLAHQEAEGLKKQHPKQSVYVIYDYDDQCFAAATESDLSLLSHNDCNFTIIYLA
tara:strand:+ start:374 stop:547 length:174 start_codon:yes stop_codon:yes gene_type:complete